MSKEVWFFLYTSRLLHYGLLEDGRAKPLCGVRTKHPVPERVFDGNDGIPPEGWPICKRCARIAETIRRARSAKSEGA